MPNNGRNPSGGGNDSHQQGGGGGGGFTGEGLVASAACRNGWGTADKGRGVIDGSRAGGKPLVDFSGDSQYVKGSLLEKAAHQGGGILPIPVVDRERERRDG